MFRWISVLINSKQEALSMALDGGRRGGGGDESSVEDLTRAITDDIRKMPGNNSCCDCGAPENELGETALDVSRRLKHSECEALLQQAQSNQFDHHVHVEYEWRLRHDDLYDSDDDFDERVTMTTECLLNLNIGSD
ncbi:hypothetical protein XENOCAPTIV_012322 [Xenoophorus captivus]|uniref:Uncharacterized protein n=1 Tax=Xenoophorus captivus TaxID=1517983 RepID=A0ABV0QHX5_9TELE